jgi:hypothetical protein
VKYGEEGSQQLKQAQPFAQNAATCHIRTTKGTAGMDQELKTSITRIGKTSLKTSTHLSYRSMSKATSYQRHPKQRWWQHKHIYTPHGQA